MYNPNDDPDVISGLCDDAKKEMATTPGPSHGDHYFEDEASPSPTSRTSASPASRTLDKADHEEPGFTVEAPAPAAKMQPHVCRLNPCNPELEMYHDQHAMPLMYRSCGRCGRAR